MKKNLFFVIILLTMNSMLFIFNSCKQSEKPEGNNKDSISIKDTNSNFKFLVEQFADVKIMRYQIPDFDQLTLKQKELLYYLSQAALCGRDIIYDQNYKYNLIIRRTLEEIYENYQGDRENEEFKKFVVYLKRVWFSNGIHHHYSTDKFFPECSKEYFVQLINNSPKAKLPLSEGETLDKFIEKITDIIYNPQIAPKRVSQNSKEDMVLNSACNFYEGVTQKEVENFYKNMRLKYESQNPKLKTQPLSYGLNSKLVKENGQIKEKVYKLGGMYTQAIEKIIYWLEKASAVAENSQQQKALNLLIEYYKTGSLEKWDEYNIEWVKDQDSRVDVVNGFIEIYGDPLGMKATWESVVNFKDLNASKRAQAISDLAQWFEDNSPVDVQYKKKNCKGVIAKVITTVQLAGDAYPATPIGINLPNASWIRKEYGSKSVTMDNITYAYDQAAIGNGFIEEFAYSKEEIDLHKKYGYLASNLHTDLHECVGHGSGQVKPGVTPEALKNYYSPIEEARADLFALYYIMDKKLIEIGVMPNLDVAKAEYNSYIRNGLLTQLTRIQPGKDIEQAHMRCRQLISKWVYEKGQKDNVIEKKVKDNKTYFVINDYEKLRKLFGELLKEVQRIKSEGDYEAAKNLVENYGVKVDQTLHKEVLERFNKLNIAPYGGFINPVLKPVIENGKIIDIKVEYPDDFIKQNLYYSKNYSFLPNFN